MLPRLYPIARPALHLWFRWSRGLTLGVRAAVLDGAERVCLVQHTYVDGWHLPGGGVEAGETASDALRRELAEEADLEPTGELSLHGVFHSGPIARRDHVLVYVVRNFRVLGQRRPDREIASSAFFALADLPAGTTRGTRARLDEIRTGRPGSARW